MTLEVVIRFSGRAVPDLELDSVIRAPLSRIGTCAKSLSSERPDVHAALAKMERGCVTRPHDARVHVAERQEAWSWEVRRAAASSFQQTSGDPDRTLHHR